MYSLAVYGNECKKELDNLGIEYANNISFTVNSRAKSRWGRCNKNRGGRYVIEINSELLNECNSLRGLKETILHEMIHTVSGCMNHGDKWKRLADKVNRRYGYAIKRTNSPEDKGLCDEAIRERNETRQQKLDAMPTYRVVCEQCGHEYIRHKMSKLITDTEHYRCACNGKLKRVQ